MNRPPLTERNTNSQNRPARGTSSSAIPVVLVDGEGASGLADMLHQFIEQTLAESPRKARLARRLSGTVAFRPAEDEKICVRIAFAGDRIELCDGGTLGAQGALITADFLTIAHLTSGRESPFRLFAKRKLKLRFSVRQLPFLLRTLSFMQTGALAKQEQRHAARTRWAWTAAAAAAAAGAAYWYVTIHY